MTIQVYLHFMLFLNNNNRWLRDRAHRAQWYIAADSNFGTGYVADRFLTSPLME